MISNFEFEGGLLDLAVQMLDVARELVAALVAEGDVLQLLGLELDVRSFLAR